MRSALFKWSCKRAVSRDQISSGFAHASRAARASEASGQLVGGKNRQASTQRTPRASAAYQPVRTPSAKVEPRPSTARWRSFSPEATSTGEFFQDVPTSGGCIECGAHLPPDSTTSHSCAPLPASNQELTACENIHLSFLTHFAIGAGKRGN